VREVLPLLDAHLGKLGVELEALTFQWFLSIFTDCLAGEVCTWNSRSLSTLLANVVQKALFRVWDVVLCVDGSTFLFQTALALLRLNETSLLECDTAAAVYSYLNSNMTHQGISIDGLIQGGDALKNQVKREDVEKKRELAITQELALSAREEGASSYTGSIGNTNSNEGAVEGSERDVQPTDDIDSWYGRAVGTGTAESVVPHGPSLDTPQVSAQGDVRNSTSSPPSAPWVLEI